MRLTPALFVRQWLSKLHPPLPQTPRESQQLLRILEGSFRKHLDEAHPPPAQRQQLSAPQLDIPLTSLESSSSATQRYFDTVLNNPLLARQSERSNTEVLHTTSAISLFVRASNEGNITIPLLRRCLADYLQGIKHGEKVLEKHRLTPKLASWLETTSPAMREGFYTATEVLSLGVQLAGIEQQEAVAWDWLRMLYERKVGSAHVAAEAPLADLKWLSIEDSLVSYLMRLSIRRRDLNDAAQQYVEACRYRSVSDRAASRPDEASTTQIYIPMESSWKRLVASIVHYRSKHGISEQLFSRALSYGMSWSLAPEFSIPVVLIYHPTSPSATPLSQHLQIPERANEYLSKQIKASKRLRRAMLIMILDGAQISLDQGLGRQAKFLLDFARTHYTELLPAIPQISSSSLEDQIQTAQEELKAHSYNFAWT